MCFEALLAILLSLAVWNGDAALSPESRTVLYSPTIDAICRVGKTPQEQAWLAAQAYSETHLASYVLTERCSAGPVGSRCDAGLATGPWQLHLHCRDAWKATTYQERLDAGARCAVRGARHGSTVCGIRGAFGFQTGIRVCSGNWIEPRVRLYRLILGRMAEVQR
jgi:hypothetical protein